MKYAFMTFSTPTLSLRDTIAVARRFGYDGVELRLDAGHAHGVEVGLSDDDRKRVREQAKSAGVSIACLATSLRFVDPATAETTRAEARARLALAADIGCPCIRVFGGPVPAGMSRQEAIEQMVRSLRAVADDAAARGVTICLETHDDWSDPRHVAAVLRDAAHPAIACNWDVMHPVRTGAATVDAAWAMLRPWIRHVHLHDGRFGEGVQLVPIGQGMVDHRAVIRLLLQAGYSGFLSGEWINWEPYEIHLPRELATLRAIERGLSGRRGNGGDT